MKRIFAIILILLFAFSLTICLPTVTAAAEDVSYLAITKDNACLYENSILQEALFTLPRTYYVKVVQMNITSVYHLVEYNGIRGLVKVEDVAATPTLNVTDPYYTATNISANAGQYLYSKPSFSAQTGTSAVGLSLPYLGKVSGEKQNYSSNTWFAVQYTNQVYYIHSQMTENIDLLETTIPLHPNSASQAGVSEGSATKSNEEAKPANKPDVVRILLIVGMIVPIVIILVVLFRPRRRRMRGRIDKEEDDY